VSFNPAPPGGTVTPEQWAAYIATLTQAYQAASGFERLKLQSEIDNANKGRQNALQLERLRGETSRYGIDVENSYKIRALEENARQFEKQHALDTRKFGLEEAQITGTYNGAPTLASRAQDIEEAQLLSSLRSEPDQMFQAMDVEQALSSIRNGRPAQQYANVTGRTTGVAAIDNVAPQYGMHTNTAPAMASPSAPISGGVSAQPTGGTGADPRIKAATAVFNALPPSETEGLDPTGVAALNAAFELYRAPLRPGTLETLSPTQRSGLKSASRRIQNVTGRSYDDFLADYERNKPGQSRSVRAA